MADNAVARILVVDDELGMREGCRRALTPHGYAVEVAEHGADGLRKLREGRFDLLLADAMMPGLSGLELLERAHEMDPHLVSVMITGYATVDLAARAIKHGALEFLPKPFTSDELLAVVDRGLEERQRRLLTQAAEERARDAQELARAEAEAAKIDAIESRFMLVIAHELRQPAAVIQSYLRLVRGGFVDAGEMPGILDQVAARSEQLIAMFDDILILGRLKERQAAGKLQPVSLAEIASQVCGPLQREATAKGLSFALQAEGQPQILAVPDHIRQLVHQLTSNAVRYTPAGGVAVRVGLERGQAVLRVSDTGIGMSTEDLERVFHEFQRTEAARALHELGTGLGLPIVQQVLRVYGGDLRIDSELGVGTTMTAFLPLAPG